jgi:hypothetical protein
MRNFARCDATPKAGKNLAKKFEKKKPVYIAASCLFPDLLCKSHARFTADSTITIATTERRCSKLKNSAKHATQKNIQRDKKFGIVKKMFASISMNTDDNNV